MEKVHGRKMKVREQLDQDHNKQIRGLPLAAWGSVMASSCCSLLNEEKPTGGRVHSKHSYLPARSVILSGSRAIAASALNKAKHIRPKGAAHERTGRRLRLSSELCDQKRRDCF